MLLVVVNPRSGSGWAIRAYEDDARSMLNVASGIKGHNILITTRAGHAAECMREVVWPYLSFLSCVWGLIADCDYESECLRWLRCYQYDPVTAGDEKRGRGGRGGLCN